MANELLYRHDEPRLEVVEQGRPWSFDGDGHLFRLVSEANRIQLVQTLLLSRDDEDQWAAKLVGVLRSRPAPHRGERLARRPVKSSQVRRNHVLDRHHRVYHESEDP